MAGSRKEGERLEGCREGSLAERVYVTLKKSIMRGEYHPGYRLIILDIASSFGVSQAPVREAMERLKHEGLLTAEPNRGSTVANLSLAEMREVYELRELIELYVLERMLPQLKEQDLAQLTELYESMCQVARQDDVFAFIELDMAFHSLFYERYGNVEILGVWRGIKEKTTRFVSITNQLYFADLMVLASGHRGLIEALRSGDSDIVKDTYLRHIEGVWGRMRKML